MQNFRAVPLTSDRWPDFERLFGPKGACCGCWCTSFRLSADIRKNMDGDGRKAFMQARVLEGPPPGILGYLDDVPAAWVQVGARADVPRWNSPTTVSRPLETGDADDPGVWAISCFFAASKFRGRGLSHMMLAQAIAFASSHGARKLEACPIDHAKQSKSVGLNVGPTRIFAAAGFAEVARRKDGRPLMRLALPAAA
jgi:GNAT superfamily N-acetyltransferase